MLIVATCGWDASDASCEIGKSTGKVSLEVRRLLGRQHGVHSISNSSYRRDGRCWRCASSVLRGSGRDASDASYEIGKITGKVSLEVRRLLGRQHGVHSISNSSYRRGRCWRCASSVLRGSGRTASDRWVVVWRESEHDASKDPSEESVPDR